MTSYATSDEDIERYEREVIPFWQGRSLRERMFAELPTEWHQAFAAGIFTEFMEQRAPGHTVADGSIYRKGLLDLKAEIATAVAALDFEADRDAAARRDQLEAMDIAADAAILFAERHAARAEEMALAERDPARSEELARIAEVCRRVPAHPPRDFWEALADLLVLSPRRHHRAQRLGRLQPRSLRPAPGAVLCSRARRRQPRSGARERTARMSVGQVQQSPRAAQGRGDRGRKRDLHGFCQHQSRWARPRRFGRGQRRLLSDARGHRRDAPAAAVEQYPALAGNP